MELRPSVCPGIACLGSFESWATGESLRNRFRWRRPGSKSKCGSTTPWSTCRQRQRSTEASWRLSFPLLPPAQASFMTPTWRHWPLSTDLRFVPPTVTSHAFQVYDGKIRSRSPRGSSAPRPGPAGTRATPGTTPRSPRPRPRTRGSRRRATATLRTGTPPPARRASPRTTRPSR